MKTRLTSIALTLAWLALAPGAAFAQETPTPATAPASIDAGTIVREEWMIGMMQGKRCGYASSILRERNTSAGKQYITDLCQEFKFQRLGQEMHIVSRSSIVENEAGVIINFQSQTSGGGSDITARGYRVGNELVLLNGAQKLRVSMPKEALGPEAFDRKTRELKLAPDAGFTAMTFIPDFAQAPVKATVRVVGRESREILGRKLDLWKTTMILDVLPGMENVIYVTDDARALLTILPFPGIGDIQMITTTRAEAMKQLESVELFAGSLVTPKQPLPNVSKLKSATLRLTTVGATAPLTLWNGPGQQVLESKPGQATVRITVPDIDEKTPTWALPHEVTPELKPYLDASFYVEQTPRLKELAKQAVGDEKNPVVAAYRIESFVRGYIRKKDLSVGFASADETAASRTGDCTEHAVLCAALGRAVGLPSRLVVGFGYLPSPNKKETGTFGFHMWAEAWIGPDQWFTMDAALSGFDVGHIAIAKTALQEVNPMAEVTMPALTLMQNLQIEVLATAP